MPDHRRSAGVVAALSGGLLVALLAGPGAWAQTGPLPPPEGLDPGQLQPEPPAPDPPEQYPPGSWDASSFEAPFDEGGATLLHGTFDVRGTLRYQKMGPAEYIESLEVRVVDDPGDSFSPADGCTLPTPATFTGDASGAVGVTAELAFDVDDVSLPCNGRYLIEAEGRLGNSDAAPYTLRQSFVIAALPAPVSGIDVTLDGATRSVTATFEPLSEADLTPDAVGYVLERRGPDEAEFVDVATIGVGDEPSLVDPLTAAPAGAYTYRVRAVRAGADGEVRSSEADADTDSIDVEGKPKATTTSARGSTSGRTGTARTSSTGRGATSGRTGATASSTPTTLDTGFEDTIDYGARGEGELAGDEPVAGQSIVRDEAAGMGLAAPAAGALVMLGWAGHILYLNRLAKQL